MAALVFALGLRHGFDPDHLVAIDGMTRSAHSRWCGLFFSLGHGLAVTLIGVAVAVAATQWRVPGWLEHAGAAISIAILVALGMANAVALARTPGGRPVRLIGARGQWVGERLARANHPAVIASIGAAFAISFDTLSHALAFSLAGATMAGVLFAAALGLVFTLGMAFTDTLNGVCVAKLMRRSVTSRWMSGAVAFLCFAIAALGVLKHAAPKLDQVMDNAALPLGVATLVVIMAVAALTGRRAS